MPATATKCWFHPLSFWCVYNSIPSEAEHTAWRCDANSTSVSSHDGVLFVINTELTVNTRKSTTIQYLLCLRTLAEYKLKFFYSTNSDTNAMNLHRMYTLRDLFFCCCCICCLQIYLNKTYIQNSVVHECCANRYWVKTSPRFISWSRKGEKGGEKKKACLFEPVQVVCLESGEAHVVAAGAAVAGRAGRAGNAYFVGSLSDPVPPAGEKPSSSVTIVLQKVPDGLIQLATHGTAYVINPVALVPVLPFTCLWRLPGCAWNWPVPSWSFYIFFFF